MSYKRAYKWLKPSNAGSFGYGNYGPHLPTHGQDPEAGWEPGLWTPKTTPNLCSSGWHVIDVAHLWDYWSPGGTLYRVECRGLAASGTDKTAWESIRLLEPLGTLTPKVCRQFATECAEKVLPIFEKTRPGDHRPRHAIEAAKDALRGGRRSAYTTIHAAYAAAADAANAAAYYAAVAIANAAAYAVYAAATAETAAVTAAYAAAAAQAAAYAAAAAAADATAETAYAAYAAANADDALLRRWAGRRLLVLLSDNQGS